MFHDIIQSQNMLESQYESSNQVQDDSKKYGIADNPIFKMVTHNNAIFYHQIHLSISGDYSPKFCMWMCLLDSQKSLFTIPIKIWGPINIPFSGEKHPIWAKLGAFLPKYTQFCKLGALGQ